MKTLLYKITPTDIIAFVLIVGCLILKGFDFNGTVSNILLTIVVFYFGKTQVFDKVVAPKISKQKDLTVEGIIRHVCEKNGVDANLGLRIAQCESGLKPNAVNVNTTGSKDRGVFQWNDYWHPEITDEMAFDVETATELFCKAIKDEHLSWWNASKSCWNK